MDGLCSNWDGRRSEARCYLRFKSHAQNQHGLEAPSFISSPALSRWNACVDLWLERGAP